MALSLILLSYMSKREQSDLTVLLGATLVQESIRKHIGASVKCFSQSCSVVHSLIFRNTDEFLKGFHMSESILSLAPSMSCLPRPGRLFCCLPLQIYDGQCKVSRRQMN